MTISNKFLEKYKNNLVELFLDYGEHGKATSITGTLTDWDDTTIQLKGGLFDIGGDQKTYDDQIARRELVACLRIVDPSRPAKKSGGGHPYAGYSKPRY